MRRNQLGLDMRRNQLGLDMRRNQLDTLLQQEIVTMKKLLLDFLLINHPDTLLNLIWKIFLELVLN
jgi:hypothetical protein